MRVASFLGASALVAFASALGCGASVDLAAASGSSTGSGGSGGAAGAIASASASAGGGASSSSVASSASSSGCTFDLPKAALSSPSSATFFGDFLHVFAQLDGGPPRYVVLQLAQGAGFVVATPDTLEGPATWVEAGDWRHARVRASDTETFVDLIDTKNPASPLIQQSAPLGGLVPPAWRDVFSVVDGELLTCLAVTPGQDAALSAIPLDPIGPPTPVPAANFYQPCGGFAAHDAGTAFQRAWLSWGAESDLLIFDASPSSVAHVADYFYNPAGVHAYGPVLSASTDGSRVVFDIGSDSRFFLYAMDSGDMTITHAYLGVQGPKRLLGVVNHVAYLATTTGIRAYDVTDVPGQSSPDDYPPPLLDFHADADFGDGLATLLASNDMRLAVTDEQGRLFVIPLDHSGPAAPLDVYWGAPPINDCP